MRASHGNRPAKFVSFSGIDGAGKSTQIEALRARLEQAGLRVLLITFWDDVARLTRFREVSGHTLFKGDKGVGTPAAPINRRDKNVRSWAMTLVRLGLYFIDAVSLRLVVKKALRSDADFVIFDRYAYDELANLALRNPANRAYTRIIMKLVPKPNISYLLDADPIQARGRKPEYPLEFLYSSRASYVALSNLLGGITIIPPAPVDDVKQQVLKHVLQQLSLDGIQRERMEMPIAEDDRSIPVRLDGRSAHPTAS
jgi:thymidylate kinase